MGFDAPLADGLLGKVVGGFEPLPVPLFSVSAKGCNETPTDNATMERESKKRM